MESDVTIDVKQEINRQDQLKLDGKFKYTPRDKVTTDGGILTDAAKLAMLVEEVGEVATCVLSKENLVSESLTAIDLYGELKQVAAVAIAWMESLYAFIYLPRDSVTHVSDGVESPSGTLDDVLDPRD